MSEFRFTNVFMSNFICCCSLDVPSDSLVFTKIGIGVVLQSGKLAGAINWTSISNYDQSWESMKCTLHLYSNKILLFNPLIL